MPASSPIRERLPLPTLLAATLLLNAGTWRHVHAAELGLRDVPRALIVQAALPPPPKDTIELKFRDLYKMPVGPRGLEPSDALLAAEGKQVRLIGFMVREESGSDDGFLLSPLPVETSEEDEGLADDLPAATIRVSFRSRNGQHVPYMPGLLKISGILRLQAHTDPQSQRVTFVQLEPDKATGRALARAISKLRSTRQKSL